MLADWVKIRKKRRNEEKVDVKEEIKQSKVKLKRIRIIRSKIKIVDDDRWIERIYVYTYIIIAECSTTNLMISFLYFFFVFLIVVVVVMILRFIFILFFIL